MSADRVCDMSCGAMHEFALVLDKAGFSAALVQQIVNSKRNRMAETMYASLVVEEPVATPAPTPLLELVGTYIAPMNTWAFVASEKFVVDTSRRAPVKISYLGDNFRAWVLGKIEEPGRATELRYSRLTKRSVDKPILDAIGEGKTEVALTDVFAMMAAQPNGGEGVLLHDGRANIFYVRDQNGVLRAVLVHWYDGGWYVNALSVESPLTWSADDRVFSRNSSLVSSVPQESAAS
ncbi:hypothetical protein A3G53_02920 [Candidatus Nomurabacteria bacterium RIFCSPLOWO2_12_FULL_44_11]|uniref:Uncharacterized protein n=1 Tax=Candidatus Nomurabacteria bacterium RIFCSPLOWO2_12_FULL_44_11 TaxID=1801796 RepID=A0A1F6Y3Q4_9BACT|nr:MAG: hypothetical protein A3G53_02920 [Candidatus Nomurabacteria bacterium RIFCSPLOWO2_12_FULL_44_11]